MKRLIHCYLTLLLLAQATPLNKTSGQSGYKYHFSVVFGGNNLAGKYGCAQTEFTFLLYREDITLFADGRSEYLDERDTTVYSGTWQYNPNVNEVTLSNHIPDTLLFVPPNILYFEVPALKAKYICFRK